MRDQDSQHRPRPYVNLKDREVKPRSHSSNTNIRKEQFKIMKSNSRLPDYQPLDDKHLNTFLQRNRVRKHLQKIGLLKMPSEVKSYKAIEPFSKDLPKIKQQGQKSLSMRTKNKVHSRNMTKTFMSKQEFDQYLLQIRQKLIPDKQDTSN